MYIYLLLSICSLTTADENQQLWGTLENVFKVASDTRGIIPEDSSLNITQLARKYQYPLEEHMVTTQDGYIITVHRIPGRKNKPVVLLMHGILESSDSWLLMGPNKALGYLLAEKGFDVWMGNCRGNKYAREHTTLNNTMIKYWNFSWEQIALYDLSAMIDYILRATEHKSLYYIGHSQGTTIGYVLCSMKPEYNAKMKMMFSLAPVAWMGHIQSPLIRMFSPAQDILTFLTFTGLNTYEIDTEFFQKIAAFICNIFPERCGKILFSISGYETKVPDTFLSVVLGHWPTGASMMQFVHFGQLVASERFQRYDFGHENMIRYGQSAPPEYDLSKVTVPVVLFFSPVDWLSDHHDVLTLESHLPNVKESVFLKDFTHIDYMYAADAVDSIYSKIIRHIDNLEKDLNLRATTYYTTKLQPMNRTSLNNVSTSVM